MVKSLSALALPSFTPQVEAGEVAEREAGVRLSRVHTMALCKEIGERLGTSLDQNPDRMSPHLIKLMRRFGDETSGIQPDRNPCKTAHTGLSSSSNGSNSTRPKDPIMLNRFGATDTPVCPECKNLMGLTRRGPHPEYGHAFELQTFTCKVCHRETKRNADLHGEVLGMIIPETPPPLRSTISGDTDDERLNRAFEDVVAEDRWIGDFIKRLNYTIWDIVRDK